MRLPKRVEASVQATKPLRSSLIARCSSGRWKNNTGNTRSAEVCCSSVTRETRPQKHPSGCIVRYRQAKSVRSGARDVLETPGGKDKWTEAGDYKGLTDTAETYAEHEASAFEIIMDDDDDDDGPDAESVAKTPRFDRNQAGSIRYAVQRDCEWAIIFVGLGRQSVQKLER